MAEPFEIMAQPFDVYTAVAGQAKPDVDDVVLTGWTLLGSSGADEYNEAGVTVSHDQTVASFTGLRGTLPLKQFRTAESVKVGFTLHDITLEQYARALNDVTVTDTPAAGQDVGSRSFPLYRGPEVAQFALLVRSENGPYGDGFPCQYWIPVVSESAATKAVVHKKGDPAGVPLEFTVLKNLDATTDDEIAGVFEAMDAASPS